MFVNMRCRIHSLYIVRTNVFSAKNPPQMEDAVLECGGAELGVVSRQQTKELALERSMTMRRTALQASLALDHKRRWKRALHHAAKHGRTARWTTSLVLETWGERSKKTNQRFLAPGCGNQQHVGHGLDCIPWFCGEVCTIPGTTVYRRRRGSP